MILVAISFHCSEGSVGAGRCPQKIFETTPFHSKENAVCDVKRALSFFSDNGRDPDAQDPLVARLLCIYIYVIFYILCWVVVEEGFEYLSPLAAK